eukprot:680463-Hanusia_phi.AAC.2
MEGGLGTCFAFGQVESSCLCFCAMTSALDGKWEDFHHARGSGGAENSFDAARTHSRLSGRATWVVPAGCR